MHSLSFLAFWASSCSKGNFITVMVKISVKCEQSLIVKKRVMFGKIGDIILTISDRRSCRFLCFRQKEMIIQFFHKIRKFPIGVVTVSSALLWWSLHRGKRYLKKVNIISKMAGWKLCTMELMRSEWTSNL